MSPPLRRWSSFHLHLPGSHGRFLAAHLAPWLEAEAASYRRFFYLRYAEGGLHLRLRFLPRGASLPRRLRHGLAACAEGYVRALGPGAGQHAGLRLEEHPYRRAELYFGDTPESVYAELLNEATSWLALRLLRTPGAEERRYRWLLLVGSLEVLLRGSARDEADRLRALQASRAFAGRLVARSGGGGRLEEGGSEAARAVRRAVPRVVSALAADPLAKRASGLLRRARARRPSGPSVATHALHLFANKLGFSAGEEALAFAALGDLGGPSRRSSGAPGEPAASTAGGRTRRMGA